MCSLRDIDIDGEVHECVLFDNNTNRKCNSRIRALFMAFRISIDFFAAAAQLTAVIYRASNIIISITLSITS